MAEFPAMPWWTDAYLADTTHLTTLEHGAYMLLLAAMWRSGDAKLPSDETRLARITKLDKRQWKCVRITLLEFFQEDSGFLTQRRLTDEWHSVQQKKEKAVASANAKWLKHKKGRHANASPKQCDGNATITTTITNKEIDQNFAEFWLAYPRKVGKGAALKAFEKAKKKTELAPMLAALARQKSQPQWSDSKFIPHPSTWLNEERWEDETADSVENGKRGIV